MARSCTRRTRPRSTVRPSWSDTFREAAGGSVQADILRADGGAAGAASGSEALGAALPATAFVREFLPLQVDGKSVAVVGFWRDAAPALARIEESRRAIVLVTVTAALIVSVLLFFIFRAAQSRITRQTEQLLAATRTDALTGMPNHGALVEQLNDVLETSRRDGKRCAVALIDIDNFRLLNETHGHAAGDVALLAVADAAKTTVPDGATCGRYGPDEFLIVAAGKAATDLQTTVEDIRARVAEGSLQFGTSERLPVTVSIGAAFAPDHAQAATELLSVAAHTLADAKAGGGDRYPAGADHRAGDEGGRS